MPVTWPRAGQPRRVVPTSGRRNALRCITVRVMTVKKPVSPASTGGAGTHFEYRVAAIVYSHLLTGTHPPGLVVPLVAVGLQQRVHGHLLDDIVLTAEPGPHPLCIEFQVKRSLTVTGADPPFVEVVTQALHQLHRRGDEVARGDLALGVVAQGDPEALSQLAALSELARGHTTHDGFAELLVRDVTNQNVRNRWAHVRKAVAAAFAEQAPDLGGVEFSAHAFLSALHVWCVSDSTDGAEYRAALDRLAPIAQTLAVKPVDLFEHLTALAQGWGVVAGIADAGTVRRHLRRRGLGMRTSDPDATTTDFAELDADAVVRGPIAALELEGVRDEAERRYEAADPAAAQLFAQIAERLEEHGMLPHAVIMRRREADARQRSGAADDAGIARAALAWDHLDAVQPWQAGFDLHDARQPGSPRALGQAAQRVVALAAAAVGVAKGADLDGLVKAFDAAEDADPYRERAAALLCEEAIADGRPAVVAQRATTLESIARASARQGEAASRRCGARILMCVADATGNWAPLLPEIHRRHGGAMTAWAHARYGRFLALNGDGAGAQAQYVLAVERACVAKMFDEAADWLYAARIVRYWYGDVAGDDDEHPLAQALRANATPSRLPGSPHTAELALSAMLRKDKPREAIQQARRWRWQAVARGYLAEEREAVAALGTLYERAKDPHSAIACFVRAGSDKQASATAQTLPEVPADLGVDILTAVEAGRAAAYATVAAAADLITDEQAREWADAAISEVAEHRAEPIAGPSARLAAFDALAALGGCLSDQQVASLLVILDPLIDRNPDHYRFSDKAVTKILISIAGRRREAVVLLLRALLADQQMAEIILQEGIEVLTANSKITEELLRPAAATNGHACLALILAGLDTVSVTTLAQQRVTRYLLPRAHHPGVTAVYAGSQHTALLASVLDPATRRQVAQAMLDMAADVRETASSRYDGLAGLTLLAPHLDEQTRDGLLPPVLQMARGEHDDHLVDDFFRRGMTLTDRALECAARLVTGDARRAEIEQIGIALLQTADEPSRWRAVRALFMAPAAATTLNLEHCAVHPIPAVRALAAVRWAQNPAVLSTAAAVRLARDDDYRVRRNLARAIRDHAEVHIRDETALAVLDALAGDPRRSVRTCVSRKRMPAETDTQPTG